MRPEAKKSIETLCALADDLGGPAWMVEPTRLDGRLLACNGHVALMLDCEELPDLDPPDSVPPVLRGEGRTRGLLFETTAGELREWAGEPPVKQTCKECKGRSTMCQTCGRSDEDCDACGNEGWEWVVQEIRPFVRFADGRAIYIDARYVALVCVAGDPGEALTVEWCGDPLGAVFVTAETWSAVIMACKGEAKEDERGPAFREGIGA